MLDARENEARNETDYEFLRDAVDNGITNIRAKLFTDGSPNSFKVVASEDLKCDTVVGVGGVLVMNNIDFTKAHTN